MTRRPALAALIASTALVLAACGSGATTAGPATAVPATAVPATAGPAQSPTSTVAASVAPSEAPATAAAATCEVVEGATGTPAEISGFSFPADLRVAAGASITWTNADGVPHTVTFADGGCDSGSIAGGDSVTVAYLVPGTYAFMCRIHPAMRGSLEVEG